MAAVAIGVAGGCGANPAPVASSTPAPTARFSDLSWQPPGSAVEATAGFTEVGVHAGRTVTIVLTADAEALFDCADAGGRRAGIPLPLKAQVSVLHAFTAETNGSVHGTLTLKPPPPAGLGCPAGSQLVLISALFKGGQFADVTSKVAGSVPGQGGRLPVAQ